MIITKLYNIFGDDYAAHKKVMEYFPGSKPVFQRNGGCAIIISQDKPVKEAEWREWTPAIQDGDEHLFSLRFNPTKREGASGKRVGINGPEVMEWLNRKFTDAGCKYMCGKLTDEGTARSMKKGGEISVRSIFIIGALKIIDAEKFSRALINGIGSAKRFGYGMFNIV